LIIEEQHPLILNVSYGNVISKVRGYVKIFRKSPLKLEQLKKNAKDRFGKELTLLIDCKTRWNSILPMLKRFIYMKDVIKDTLAEYNYDYDKSIEPKVQQIIECLLPVQESILKLGSSNCDLLIAEATCIYLLSTLKNLKSQIGIELYEAVTNRVNERRNVELISAFYFLHTGEYPKDNIFFKYSSKSAIKKKLKELSARLFSDVTAESQKECSLDTTQSSDLHGTIKMFLYKPFTGQSIDGDIKAFEGTKERTDKLQKLYNALKTIQATSTSVERSFSVAGSFFKTKTRNKLSADKLDALVYLKYHFINN